MAERIAVVGLGYVGLPVAVGVARHFAGVVGFDIKVERVAALSEGIDVTGDFTPDEFDDVDLRYNNEAAAIADRTLLYGHSPHMHRREAPARPGTAARCVPDDRQGTEPGTVLVFESTVYPGATERICGPILAEVSGLRQCHNFKLARGRERINHGDLGGGLDSSRRTRRL